MKKLESTNDDRKRDRLQKELTIIHNQRMKGVAAMRSAGKDDNSDGNKKGE